MEISKNDKIIFQSRTFDGKPCFQCPVCYVHLTHNLIILVFCNIHNTDILLVLLVHCLVLVLFVFDNDPGDDGPQAGLDRSKVEVACLEALADVVVDAQGLDAPAQVPLETVRVLHGQLARLPLLLLVGRGAGLPQTHHQLGGLEANAEEGEELDPELRRAHLVLGSPAGELLMRGNIRVVVPLVQPLVDTRQDRLSLLLKEVDE